VRYLVTILFWCVLNAANSDPALAGLAAALSSHEIDQVYLWEQRLLSGNSSADILLSAGALLGQHDMLRDAATMFEKCSDRFPALFEAKYNLALARIGLNDYLAAQKVIRSASPSSVRESAAIEYLRGKIYSATGYRAEARQSLERAYRSNPDNENYALDLALLYIQSSAYVPAIQMLQPSLASHPESEELAIELALSDALAGRQAEALAVCRQLLNRNSQLPTPRLIAAFTYCVAADYGHCETESSLGLSLPAANPYLHYLYAEALWNLNPTATARPLAELDAALKAMRYCRACLLLRSRVFEAMKDYGAAVTDIRTVLQQDSKSAEAWYRLATLCRRVDDARGAADAVNHYRALNEKHTSQEVESFREQFLDIREH